MNFTYAIVLLMCLSSTLLVQSQNFYRSAANGTWGTLSTWEFSSNGGGTWGAASVVPDNTNSESIVINHNVSVTANRTVDQVTVNSGAILSMTGTTGTTLTVAQSAPMANDLIVNGTLVLGTTSNTNFINGAGQVQINATLDWQNGRFNAPTTITSTGIATLSNSIQKNLGGNFTNNGIMNWYADNVGGSITLNSGITFTNNGTINFYATAPASRGLGNSGSNSFINNGTLNKIGTGTFNNTSVAFTNSSTGILSGTGTFNLTNTVVNNGTIKPGTSPGELTVSQLTVHNQSTTIELEVLNNSGAGTGYDHLILNGTPNLANATIRLINIAPGNNPAPLGTYELVTGAHTNNPAFILPNNYIYDVTSPAGTIRFTKIALFPLPVVWGAFEARLKGSDIELTWETLSEENTLEFIIEHSTDGNQYSPVAKVNARGNSNVTTSYQYRFTTPNKQKTNFFRIKQVDQDGKNKYSDVRLVKFNKGDLVKVNIYPNPVQNELKINAQVGNIAIAVSDMYGRTILTKQLQAGTEILNVQQLAKGYYLLSVYEDGALLETKKIVKQ